MKNEKHAGRLLPAVLAGAAAFVLLAAASCDTTNSETPETYPDITIPYEGKTITIKGLASNDPAREKIKDAVDLILENSGGLVDTFKSYAQTKGLTITVENVPAYDTGWDFRLIDDDEFAIRYDFVSTETVSDITGVLVIAVNSMNNIYQIVP
jgi:hypothetical protein